MLRITDKKVTIGVFSPSYAVTYDAPEAALRAERLVRAKGFGVKRGSLWGKKSVYRSGTARERADEFNELLHDPQTDWLMASAGGFVTNGMLPYIDYDYYREHPKPLIGMSDVTALLMAVYAKTGRIVYYGTNFVTSFARMSPYCDIAFDCMRDVVSSCGDYTYTMPEYYSDEVTEWEKEIVSEKKQQNRLVTLRPGKARGRLIGGNLNTLTGIWGSEYMPEIKRGDILFLENTEEWTEYTERYVAWLKLCGVFDIIGGLIVGKHRAFDDLGTGKASYEILMEALGEASFPILAETDFSHCAPMLTLPIGVTAELDADKQTVRLLR